MPKAARHKLIRELIASERVASQEALVSLLAQRGETATQATVSRDLRDLGVLKGSTGYQLPSAVAVGVASGYGAATVEARPPARSNGQAADRPPLAEPLVSSLRRFLASAERAASLVVLKTSPGYASVIAVELDRLPPAGVVGTVAGDDTIFIATRSEESAAGLTALFREVAGITPKARPLV
jgi:transcriptional regulator of arginine metabolism